PTNTLTADHYTYLPSIGIAVMLAWGIGSLLKRAESRRKILAPVSVLVLAIIMILTWQQCGYWKNGVELWTHALKVTKDNYLAHHNMGTILFKKGKAQEAFHHFDRAIHINPNNRSYNARGDILARAGRYQQAIDDFSKAISLNIHDAYGYYNRGLTYERLGQYRLAIEDFTKAISIKPDFALAYSNRGISYFSQRKNEQGCNDARKACELENCSILQAAKGKGLCR
ncbi:MAG: tetratricopeptide repeat protein, partial [Syntrophaceae bacterium]|nr:tetratricopeptide repeat protein [Syntrophaceae bacterium]